MSTSTRYSFQAKDQINNDIFSLSKREVKFDPFYVTVRKVRHEDYELICPVVSYCGSIYRESTKAKVRRNTALYVKEHGRSLWLLGEHLLEPLDILYIKDWTRSITRKNNQHRYVLIVHEYEKMGKWKSDETYDELRTMS